MRDTKHLEKFAKERAQKEKEKKLFKNKIKAVEAGARRRRQDPADGRGGGRVHPLGGRGLVARARRQQRARALRRRHDQPRVRLHPLLRTGRRSVLTAARAGRGGLELREEEPQLWRDLSEWVRYPPPSSGSRSLATAVSAGGAACR